MARYSFLTTWALDAPVDDVWEAIHATERWPEWWRGVKIADRLGEGDGDGVGSIHRYVWRSRLPYDIEFRMRTTRLERPFLLEGEADGELRGTGRWRLWSGRGTAVTYEWNVETTIPWMNAIAPIGRPAFRWSHNHVMRNGGRGLARLLGSKLFVCD
ncbi:MAG: SRPBCC family protein [Gaiellaceae bacterium MAG52_C11]|nr:SRPBCC family protein [Candidatus Gaiellasilicea maunaloa]